MFISKSQEITDGGLAVPYFSLSYKHMNSVSDLHIHYGRQIQQLLKKLSLYFKLLPQNSGSVEVFISIGCDVFR